ncbi:sesquipedalian-1 isoform X1 [Syngnathoides biaculeatus]|uniref:sesquipedalian-1 isoform X1 n=1 Tax=Syngnathoides biaculeatus TaxID=300417 RepID=UPI002ADDC632|nr:sesquipedalian-1 isoform X1 [Syngnathoides biaculeatus]
MKLHVKILTHYLTCTSPVDKEGYLFKKVPNQTCKSQLNWKLNPRIIPSSSQKQRNGSYCRRWFVLKGNLLFYQERPADRRLLGVIVLEGCAVRRAADAVRRFCFGLVFRGPEPKRYHFAAGNEDAAEGWVRALLSASHCYLSLLLRDLHVQYQALKPHQGFGESPPSNLNLGPPPPSSSSSLSPSAKVTKKSPKPRHRRNAHVATLNVPTPPSYAGRAPHDRIPSGATVAVHINGQGGVGRVLPSHNPDTPPSEDPKIKGARVGVEDKEEAGRRERRVLRSSEHPCPRCPYLSTWDGGPASSSPGYQVDLIPRRPSSISALL